MISSTSGSSYRTRNAPECYALVMHQPLLQLPLALLVLCDPAMQADPIHSTSRLGALMGLISAGYFVYDVAQVVARYEDEGPQYMLHAICCLLVFLYPVFSHKLQFYGEGHVLVGVMPWTCCVSLLMLCRAGIADYSITHGSSIVTACI